MTRDNPHLQQRVEHYGVPVRDARVVVVLVHGRTITPEYMYEHVVQPLALDDARVLGVQNLAINLLAAQIGALIRLKLLEKGT